MPIKKTTELIMEREFDRQGCRHQLNGKVVVLHCHHYMSLYTQLAEDCGMLDGRKLLAEVAEDAFRGWLAGYYRKNGIDAMADRIAIAEQLYAVAGLGKMAVTYVGEDSASIVLENSHVDEGWIKKWGQREAPVNYVTRGYVAGMLEAVYDLPARSFSVTETESIVSGAPKSVLAAVRL